MKEKKYEKTLMLISVFILVLVGLLIGIVAREARTGMSYYLYEGDIKAELAQPMTIRVIQKEKPFIEENFVLLSSLLGTALIIGTLAVYVFHRREIVGKFHMPSFTMPEMHMPHVELKKREFTNLEKYIIKQKDNGFSKEEINEALKDAGWERKDITEAFGHIAG